MYQSQTEPMALRQVHTTTDYGRFTSIDGNRNLNLLHLQRLKKSIQENYLFTIIIVNEKFEIIDGQHRFEAVKVFGLPLHYIICEGYGLEQVQILNANSKTWNADDYLEGYVKLGKSDYMRYKQFKDKYDFPHKCCMSLLRGHTADASGSLVKQFYNGKFQIGSYKRAVEIAEAILLIAPFYEGYKRICFIMAMTQVLNKAQFELTEFIAKLRTQPSVLFDCQTTAQYVSLIEEIYNYRRRDKVNLRY
jgi:hypothetical protein